MKKKMNYLILLLTTIFIVGCTNVEDTSNSDVETDAQEVTTVDTKKNSEEEKEEETAVEVLEEPIVEEATTKSNNELFAGYKLIEVDGGDISGYREPKVVVDIGFGDREYWAFTNTEN